MTGVGLTSNVFETGAVIIAKTTGAVIIAKKSLNSAPLYSILKFKQKLMQKKRKDRKDKNEKKLH